jgi:hypothetical protein
MLRRTYRYCNHEKKLTDSRLTTLRRRSRTAQGSNISKKQLSTFTSFLLAACLGLQTGQAADERIYLTRGGENNQPGTTSQTEFHCSDTIMAVLAGDWPVNSEHVFEAYWVNSRGREQEHSRQKFTAYGSTRVWVWLRLHAGERSMLDKMLMEENTSLQEFAGEWEVTFYLDGKKTGRQYFNVAC